jgi:hypothetical protein
MLGQSEVESSNSKLMLQATDNRPIDQTHHFRANLFS